MRKFMDKDFLLKNKTAKKLYHGIAEKTPIIDYHCHLNPREIAEDKHYSSITEVWLGGDHYKWRIMRGFGVDERYITGDATDKEKFMKWAEVMPYCVGNPLYHWTHLELRRYFGINDLLCPENAERIWEKCNELLKKPEFGARGLIRRSNVELIGTTDDPCDDLAYHEIIEKDESFDVRVVPSYRPERALNIWRPEFCGYIKKLSAVVGYEINTYSELVRALDERLDFFVARGCKSADHSLNMVKFCEPDEACADAVFRAKLEGRKLTAEQIDVFYSTLFVHLAKKYYEHKLVMQLHIAVLRDNNTAAFEKLGVDMGFDTMSDVSVVEPVISLLDMLEREDKLPKTVLYSLNPAHNEALMALATCFNGHGIAGKIQIGSAWWLNDHIDGMEKHMKACASMTLFSKFIGMLTDSRSFLSYTRHEYFRRIVCNIIGTWAENGEAPNDMELLGRMVRDICYTNTKEYFFG
ncbi:MAG: glucuronate isomerase [Oscillospiraceae bacterium]|nr:glucuronate isomerase [Oscillospiraceae bacterium]MBQ6902521.1 glucuronate isomerase [Oscillospiraceae bacterium]